jgi:16S rRNA A1518/A1519 N6-dimethyltransferase RsmA/KsgA/DIM1 with predicted DNA glycosylase/AP lyase activity
MLRQSLRQITDAPQALLAAAEIPETARAEELDIAEFLRARARSAKPGPLTTLTLQR